MEKFFIKCLDKTNIDKEIVTVFIIHLNFHMYKNLTTNEMFDKLFWDIIFSSTNLSSDIVKLLLMKYGDELLPLMKQHIKNNEKKYCLSEEDKLIFHNAILELF